MDRSSSRLERSYIYFVRGRIFLRSYYVLDCATRFTRERVPFGTPAKLSRSGSVSKSYVVLIGAPPHSCLDFDFEDGALIVRPPSKGRELRKLPNGVKGPVRARRCHGKPRDCGVWDSSLPARPVSSPCKLIVPLRLTRLVSSPPSGAKTTVVINGPKLVFGAL